MPNFKLTTSAIIAGISVNAVTTASADECILDTSFEIDQAKDELNVSKHEIGYNPQGGLLGSGFCCADCREWGGKIG